MASREFIQYSYQLERGVVKLYARVSIGATGAPTLVTTSTSSGNPSKGIVSVARTAAGTYRITFGKTDAVQGTTYDRYQRILNVTGVILDAGVSAVNSIQIKEDQSSADVPYVDIYTLGITAGAVAAVDPTSGDALLVEITLKNSQV
jgi:hypothetical protein